LSSSRNLVARRFWLIRYFW